MHFYLTFSPTHGIEYLMKTSKELAEVLKINDAVDLKSFVLSNKVPFPITDISGNVVSPRQIADELSDFDMIVSGRRLEMVGGIETLYINLKEYESDKE